MRFFLTSLFAPVLVAVGLFLPPVGCGPPPSPDLQSQVLAPYVEVRTQVAGGWSVGAGTAIKVDKETLVLTAGHVVASAKDSVGKCGCVPTVLVLKESPRSLVRSEADLVYFSPDEDHGGHDLALLRVSGVALTPARLIPRNYPLIVGEDAWTIGTPGGLHQSLDKTVVNQVGAKIRGQEDRYVVVNGSVWFGSSGGGVYVVRDGAYQLAGVITQCATPGLTPKSPGACKPPEIIHQVLEEYLKTKEKP